MFWRLFQIIVAIPFVPSNVLHAFQKKAKKGIVTPKAESELVKQQLKRAIELHSAWEKQHG